MQLALVDACGFAARLVLGGVFLASAMAKARQKEETDSVLHRLLGNARLRMLARRVLAIIEFCLGAALLVGISPRFTGAAATATLVVFTAIVIAFMAAGTRVSCECFGAGSESPIGIAILVRNLGFLAAALMITATSGGFLAFRGFDAGWHPTPTPEDWQSLLLIVEISVLLMVFVAGMWLRRHALENPPKQESQIGPVWHGEIIRDRDA